MRTEEISWYIDKFRRGDEEGAFHGLSELTDDAVPELIERFRAEALAPSRALAVKALWERRDPSIIPFLSEALQDCEEEVWQEALDGLVTLASAERWPCCRKRKSAARAAPATSAAFSSGLKKRFSR